MYCRENPHWAGTAGALEQIDGENTTHQLRPAIVARPWTARLLLGTAPLPWRLFPLDDSALQPRWGWRSLIPQTGTTVRPASSGEPQGSEPRGTCYVDPLHNR